MRPAGGGVKNLDEVAELRAEIVRLDVLVVMLIMLAREHGIDARKICKLEREYERSK